MRELELVRLDSSDYCTRGVLVGDNARPLVTLEPPWVNNQPVLSCIPPGGYDCEATVSPRHGPTYQLMGVPGRTEIIIHAGNSPKDTKGCILLGLSWGYLNGRPAVRHSKAAMHEFLSLMAGEKAFKLCITEAKR